MVLYITVFIVYSALMLGLFRGNPVFGSLFGVQVCGCGVGFPGELVFGAPLGQDLGIL